MKLLAIFVALISVAVAVPPQAYWTLQDLSLAIQEPTTDPAFQPYLQNALNNMMTSLFAGEQIESTVVTVPTSFSAPSTWTLQELSHAIQDPSTDAAVLPYLNAGLEQIMTSLFAGQQTDSIVMAVPASSAYLTSWTLQELSEAIQDPSTNPALLPHLNYALDNMMNSLFSGVQTESIVIALPAVLTPVVTPGGAVTPIAPEVAVTPIAPEAAVTPASSSPLVQILVNINQA